MAVFSYLYFNNVVARQTVTVGYMLQKSLQLDGPHMLELFTKLGAPQLLTGHCRTCQLEMGDTCMQLLMPPDDPVQQAHGTAAFGPLVSHMVLCPVHRRQYAGG
jgi:hypothetical protein